MSSLNYHIHKEQDSEIKDLQKHADIANQEMGVIKVTLGTMQTDIEWLKKITARVDARVWYILTAVVIGFLLVIGMRIFCLMKALNC